MVYIVAFLLEMAVIFRKRFMKHNNAVALSVCFIAFLFVVGGFNSTNPDYHVYETLYFDRFPGNYSVTEPLYVFLNKFVYSTGLPFKYFFAAQILVSLILMQRAIRFFTKNSDIVWGYYMLFPFAISIVQIRYALASSIVIYAFTFLYKYHTERKLPYLIVFSAMTFTAGMIHFSTLVFLICAVPEFFSKKHNFSGVVWGVMGAMLLANVGVLGKYVAPLIGARKAENWLAGAESFSISHVGLIFVLRSAVVAAAFLLYVFASRREIVIKGKDLKSMLRSLLSNEPKSHWLFQMIIFQVLTFMPLELFSQQFVRLTRVYLFLVYMLYASEYNKRSVDTRFAVDVVMTGSLMLICAYEYTRGMGSGLSIFNTVFRTVFENNLLY